VYDTPGGFVLCLGPGGVVTFPQAGSVNNGTGPAAAPAVGTTNPMYPSEPDVPVRAAARLTGTDLTARIRPGTGGESILISFEQRFSGGTGADVDGWPFAGDL
jgi:hypothetical protein